ncbi:hypothetical protein [Sinisalibacter aestuarii]|uniref:Translocase n=1 Tax=Sinisalibacter aestuarii TaxID=2949426 RepID=A0ABQ5LN85_9RHOB|nr:hypothetical protein [Sinisalibacter aestuarii]GKY86416.1 hypothetical protein STA1M1_02850 [Sinisalibacter aestuarii]
MIADLKAKAAGIDRKRIYTAAAALLIAGAAGHFMQKNSSAPSGKGPMVASAPAVAGVAAPKPTMAAPAPQILAAAVPAPETPAEAPAVAPVDVVAEAPLPAIEQPMPSFAEANLVIGMAPEAPSAADPMPVDLVTRSEATPSPILATPDPVPAAPPVEEIIIAAADVANDLASEPAPPVATCEIAMDLAAEAPALVAITLSAPCNSGEEVTFSHAGMIFSEQLGPEGDLFLAMPAMEENAIVTATFSDGQEAAGDILVPDFAEIERVALVWKGPTGLQLHALENGANYGEAGHIWAETPASAENAIAGTGGFVSALGSTADGYAADIYTYPAALMLDGQEPDISIEAQVMENTCAHEIAGTILRSNPGRAATVQSLSMAVPGCDAVGEYLVLKNLPQDLKLARN